MNWIIFTLTYAVFVASHLIPARPAIRMALIGRLGRGGYLLVYSVVSLGLLYALIRATGAAPRLALWPQNGATRWVVNLAMPLVMALIALSVGRPNPFSFGGKEGGFDPARPGIIGVTRQPLPLALALWALAHLWANGDLAHVLFFGGMAVFALLGMAALEARARRRLGADYARLSAHAPLLPLAKGWPRGWEGTAPLALRLAVALLLWAGFYHLHPALFLASPQP